MNEALVNLLSPPILFFFVGLLAAVFKSDLEFPPAVAKALALYLLVSIGLSGGVEIAHEGFTPSAAKTLAVSLGLAFSVPFWVFFILVRFFRRTDAAAIAATYGSVSAVTFITAMAFLDRSNIPYNGYMVAALAIMESPAIIVGLYLAKGRGLPWKLLMREALLNGSIVVLLGSLAIGMLSTPKSVESLQPFLKGIFPGVLCLFLLDMGIVSGRRLGDLFRAGARAVVPAVAFPPIHAAIAIVIAHLLGLGQGDALLLSVLAASASYIAVPAAMRVALPDANPGIYVPMALAVTFPFNILAGIPLYMQVIQIFWK
jgi:hypothetical protein